LGAVLFVDLESLSRPWGHRGRTTALGEAVQILAFRLLGQLCLIGRVLLE
jgi:hypothetical protein